MGALGSDNFQMPTGRIVDGGIRYVRSLARYQTIDELREPHRERLVLSDIADVQREGPHATISNRRQ